MSGSRTELEPEFRRLYAAHGRDLMTYALRRARTAEDAADVVAETFLVAWRKVEEIPAGEEARLWLYGVARLVLANHLRGERRRGRLAERLRNEVATSMANQPTPEPASAVMSALGRLKPNDREVLMLAAWEELEPAQIGEVLGLSGVAVRSRLHRARRRLRQELAWAGEPHEPHSSPSEMSLEEAR
ncbi:MAG TPA: RNA polymerase sigma factor [Solirubrobacterales bacterium]